MTRYARPQAGKREAEEGSSWSNLKQSIKQDGAVVKKLKKKKKPKDQVVKDAVAAEAVQKEGRKKLGKGSLKFSKMDPEARRAGRAEVHKRRRGKNNPCFVCRSTNHKASKCPKGSEKGLGMCFKCGSVPKD